MTIGRLRIEAMDLRKTRRSGDSAFVLDVPRFDLASGDRVALIGQSGSGKSTLIGLLALALAPDPGGTLVITTGPDAAVDTARLWKEKRDGDLTRLRRRLFGYVQQKDGLLPFLTVEENIRFPLVLAGQPDRGVVRRLAERLGIGNLLRRHPQQISVGQRQRVNIARAVIGRPGVILADEPTAALDHDNSTEVLGLLVEQAQDYGAALVLATHNTALADAFAFEPVVARIQSGARTVFAREGGHA